MSQMSTECWIVFFVILLTTRDFVHGSTSANTPIHQTCRRDYLSALHRHCAYQESRKRNTAPPPMPGAPVEEEVDYSDIIGLALNHADTKAQKPEIDAQLYSDVKSLLGPSGQENPNEEHSMFYKERYPIFQQPRIDPLSAFFNSFGGQQPQQQQPMGMVPPPYAYGQYGAPFPVPINPRIRRMYDMGHQLVTKCCGVSINCYGQELAVLSPDRSNDICGK